MAGALGEPGVNEKVDKVLVIDMVRLLKTVVGTHHLAKNSIMRGREIVGGASKELGIARVSACERIAV